MAISKRLKRLLKSDPSTSELPKYLDDLESKIPSDGGYDDTEIQGKVSDLETTVGNHTSSISDLEARVSALENPNPQDIQDET